MEDAGETIASLCSSTSDDRATASLCSSSTNGRVTASPAPLKGRVMVKHSTECSDMKEVTVFKAHKSHLAYLALSHDGNLLATASVKGTLIRIFETVNGTLVREFRRGLTTANISSMAFSDNAQWLLVSSHRGTIHVFRVKDEDKNPPSYMHGRYSFGRFRLPKGSGNSSVAFGSQRNSVEVVSGGKRFTGSLDPVKGGEFVLHQ